MGRRTATTVAVVILVGIASSGFAQSTESSPAPLPNRAAPVQAVPAPDLAAADAESAAQLVELDHWVKEFSDWLEWSAQWRGRREPGLFTGSRTRREKPAPPA